MLGGALVGELRSRTTLLLGGALVGELRFRFLVGAGAGGSSTLAALLASSLSCHRINKQFSTKTMACTLPQAYRSIPVDPRKELSRKHAATKATEIQPGLPFRLQSPV